MPTIRHHTVQVPATSANLGPGFDAFGLAVSRHLVVQSGPRSRQTERVRAAGEGAGELDDGDGNLIWRSLVRFCEEHDASVPDVALAAVSEIPLERGLGSSSAAIVAGLTLGRALTGVAIGDRDLVSLASTIEGHPDNVAPALLGGLTVCATADDGTVVVRRAQPAPRLRPVVLVPVTRQATIAARGVLPDGLPRAAVAEQAARAGHVLGALLGTWPADPRVTGDLLHEPPRLEVMGPTGELVRALRDAGIHAWLSGAGPTVAAAVAGHDLDAVERCRSAATASGFTAYPLDWELTGALACPEDACGIGGQRVCVHCPAGRV